MVIEEVSNTGVPDILLGAGVHGRLVRKHKGNVPFKLLEDVLMFTPELEAWSGQSIQFKPTPRSIHHTIAGNRHGEHVCVINQAANQGIISAAVIRCLTYGIAPTILGGVSVTAQSNARAWGRGWGQGWRWSGQLTWRGCRSCGKNALVSAITKCVNFKSSVSRNVSPNAVSWGCAGLHRSRRGRRARTVTGKHRLCATIT